MVIREVKSNEDKRQFQIIVNRIYNSDPNYIRPLDKDIEAVFNQNENYFERTGDSLRFLLFRNNQDSKPIGRIAAFYHDQLSDSHEQPTGGIGFFECIKDQEAANELFDAAKNWLSNKGAEAMDGPINFGEKNKFWGLLVEGFIAPTYLMNYNPPYYKELSENHGFKTSFKQFVFSRKVNEPVQEVYKEKADRISKNGNYKFAHFKKTQIRTFAEYFMSIYNRSWAAHNNFKALKIETALKVMHKLKPVIIEELIWFGFYKNEPVSFFIMLPELNEIFKYFNGKFGWFQKLQFFALFKLGKIKNIFGLIFGVVPEHQGKGVEGAMIMAAAKKVQPKKRWQELEMTWIGNFNPKMIHIVEQLGAKRKRTYHTYRFLFDSNKEFKRAPIINE